MNPRKNSSSSLVSLNKSESLILFVARWMAKNPDNLTFEKKKNCPGLRLMSEKEDVSGKKADSERNTAELRFARNIFTHISCIR
jgi:hypothetical protein